jgi:hypothetical protein
VARLNIAEPSGLSNISGNRVKTSILISPYSNMDKAKGEMTVYTGRAYPDTIDSSII